MTDHVSFDAAVDTLLTRLDLTQPGLAPVRAAGSDRQGAATALLDFHRARTSITHPVQAELTNPAPPLSPATRAIADDALKNVLVTCPHYPRHDFGPDIDWLTNRAPNDDKEWLWQLNRHSSWGALAAAYLHTADDIYAQCYVRQLLDWISKCPLQQDSPAWRTIEAGIRGFHWTRLFLQFLRSPAYTPEALVRQLNAFHDHAHYLTNREMRTSNWGLMEAEGAAFIAMTFPEFKAAPAWRRKAFTHLNAMMQTQVRPDGHQYEQCLGYHLGCISWFARTAEMAGDNGFAGEFPESYWKTLERMCEVPMKLGLPNGSNTQFGDDHSSFNWRGTLLKWATLFNRDDLLFSASAGRQGRLPAETAFALPDSGFYSMRSGWDEKATMLVLKCGPSGGWHCQPDNGCFELYAGGRRLTPDSGTYIYNGNEQALADRAWFRQSRVHPVLTLDGQDNAFAPRQLLWQPGRDLDVLVVQNAGREGFIHRRTVFFVERAFFVLVDDARGDATGNAWLHFQLPPAPSTINPEALAARTGFADGANLLIQGMSRNGLSLVMEEGRLSPHYGKQEFRPAFRFERRKDTHPVRFVTLLIPFEGQRPVVQAISTPDIDPASPSIEVDIHVNGKPHHLTCTPPT